LTHVVSTACGKHADEQSSRHTFHGLIIGGASIAASSVGAQFSRRDCWSRLAGLSAAYELAGAVVTLLDARPYAGGRVKTIRECAGKQHGELGGEFIETEHREILDLCRGFDLLLCRFCGVRLRTDSAGRTLSLRSGCGTRTRLQRRTGRVVFAGEHTSERWQGYMNGAVESGQRAARELPTVT
jgi:hypothetical protein